MLTMGKIVVAGGAGFIGSHLCGYLLGKGEKVVCIDSLVTGNRANIAGLLGDKNFSFINRDVSGKFTVRGDVRQVYNLASPASPVDYQEKPLETLAAGSNGVKNLLELAEEKNAAYLFASTSEVYGNPTEHPQKETYWGNVNPVGPRSCFSSDTQVLTYEGWKLFNELAKDDLILTRNSSGFIEYHKPVEIIKEKYIGDLISFKNTKIDLLITPNHNMLVKVRGKSSFSFVPAFEGITWHKAEMQKGAKWVGENKEYFYLPKVKNSKSPVIEKIKMPDWLEFLGYFLSEGCTYLQKKKKTVGGKIYDTLDYVVLISQSKKSSHREKIRSCLQRLNVNFFEENAQFRILNKQLFSYLAVFGKSKDKFIPPEFKSFSKEYLQILFASLMAGDGSRDGKAFYSSSYKLIGDMQELLLKLGCAGSVVSKDARKKNPVYQIHILTGEKKDFLTPKYPKRNIVKYAGDVYCVNVPNHVIYVRRNGKSVFCGNCYDEAKRFGEALCVAFSKVRGVDVKIARIFNTYGPMMRKNDGRVVPNFIEQALGNEPLTVYGKGGQTRSFCYVSDMVNGICALMNSRERGPINLGNPVETSISGLAEKIIRLSKSRSRIVYQELPIDDPERRLPDISLAKSRLSWAPKVSLDEGLNLTISYFQKL